MSDERVIVRPAEPGDADGIARVHVDSWRETYAGLVPDRYFSEEAYERRRRWWARNLAPDTRIGTIAVATRGERVVGFASAGPAEGPDVEKGHAAVRGEHLYTIYLLATEHGGGTGRALLGAVLADRPAQLWVAAGNAHAIAFYERNGFSADGVQVADPAIDDLVEIRMVR